MTHDCLRGDCFLPEFKGFTQVRHQKRNLFLYFWTQVAGFGFVCNEVAPPMSIRTIVSPATLLIFPGAPVQKLQKLLQANICHHGMLVKLQIYLRLQKGTNTYVQLHQQKSDLKRSRRRWSFLAEYLWMIFKGWPYRKKAASPGQSSVFDEATPQTFTHRT